MNRTILIVSDSNSRSSRIADLLGRRYRWEMVVSQDLARWKGTDVLMMFIDIDVANQASIDALRTELPVKFARTPKIFLAADKRYATVVQANALGATTVLVPPFTAKQVMALVERSIDVPENIWADWSESERLALNSATLVDASIIAAVESGRALPKADIATCSALVADSLADTGISSWLHAVKAHHSYTHRHCLTVSGLAVAFAQHCRVSPEDVRRMAVCGLLHDVGKAKIPLSILDKPGQLSDAERQEISRHPEYGYDILIADNQFDASIIDMTRHHHELLDGSGYPDGLTGGQISDMVRMLTIVDIYSALIDKRSYKKPLAAEEAYGILEGMTGKIDMDILRAFKPIALAGPPASERELTLRTGT